MKNKNRSRNRPSERASELLMGVHVLSGRRARGSGDRDFDEAQAAQRKHNAAASVLENDIFEVQPKENKKTPGKKIAFALPPLDCQTAHTCIDRAVCCTAASSTTHCKENRNDTVTTEAKIVSPRSCTRRKRPSTVSAPLSKRASAPPSPPPEKRRSHQNPHPQ